MSTGKTGGSGRGGGLGSSSFFLGGMLSVLVQAVVLRESLFARHQAELASGVVLASWIAGSGLGAVIGGRSRHRLLLWRAGVLLMPLLGAAQVLSARTGWLPLPLTVLPLGLLAGMVFIQPFAFGDPGRVYAMEALGAAAGGGLFVLLAPWTLSGGMLAFSILAAALALVSSGRKSAGLVLGGLTLLSLALGVPGGFDRLLANISFEGYESVEVLPSPYGEVAVAERSGQHAVFRGGILESTWPAREWAEAVVAVPLAASMPERVLYIGSSPEECGLLEEWPGVEDLSCVVPDGTLLETAAYPTGTETGDGRRYVDGCAGGFDLVAVSTGQPLTLLANRFYTEEFMETAVAALNDSGMMSLRLPGGANRLHPLEADLARSVQLAAAKHFDWVRVLPMAGVSMLMGRGTEPDLSGEVLASSLDSAGYRGLFVNSGTLPFDLSPMRVSALSELISASPAEMNRDLHPEGFLLAHRLWSERTGGPLENSWIAPAAAGLLLIMAAAAVFTRDFRSAMGVASAGFSGLSVEAISLVAVQASTGYSWVLVGAITGLFMTGAAAGALTSWKFRLPVRHWLLISTLSASACACSLAAYDGSIIDGRVLSIIMLSGTFLCGSASGGAFSSAAAGLAGHGTFRIGLLGLADYGSGAAAALLMPLVLFPLAGAAISLIAAAGWTLAWYGMQFLPRGK
ncbi:MAG: hypothetical protein AVO35_09540 [Candidatus Aegiribacteria sp. MLS_C]|nr:MAG: hypothetical protein AVO35_09540 [Candidatus Aegiribacteria sp. MLS_C]